MDNVKTITQWLDEPMQSINTQVSTAEWARIAKEEKKKRMAILCEAVGCHRVTIMNYANGKLMPSVTKRHAIAKAIGAPVLFMKGLEVKVTTHYETN